MKERIDLPQDIGSPDPAHAVARAAARVGDFGTSAADVERCAAHPAGLAVPGAAPVGAARVDQGSMGGVGQ